MRLARDLWIFAQILIYWVSVWLLLRPAGFVDRRLGTRLLPPLIRLTKRIGTGRTR